MAQLQGILTATLTPMTPNGESIDESAARKLVNRLIHAGVGGLIPGGSTGEFWTLTDSERREILELTIDETRGRVPVVAHVSALSTTEAVALSKHAQAAGAAAILAMPPFYEPVRWSELVVFYETLSSAVNAPIIFYHIPSSTGMDLTPKEIAELAKISRIEYTKFGSPNAIAFSELMFEYSDRIKTISAWDSLTYGNLVLGASVVISGAPNLLPELWVGMFNAIRQGQDFAAAYHRWLPLWRICHFLENEGYVSALKAGCDVCGEPAGPPRPPLQPIDEAARARLARLINEALAVVPSARV